MFEGSLADLQKEEAAFRKLKLIAGDVPGSNSLIRGTHRTVCWSENGTAWLKLMMPRSPMLPVFSWVGFRKQGREDCYAPCLWFRSTWKEMRVMPRRRQMKDLKEVVYKQIPDSIEKDVEMKSWSFYPLYDVSSSGKWKMLKRPKFELGAPGLHGEAEVLEQRLVRRQMLKFSECSIGDASSGTV